MENAAILVINPGSTSTKLALFRGKDLVSEKYIECDSVELEACKRIIDQVPMRTKHVAEFLESLDMSVSDCDAVAARGAPLRPVAGGVYRVNDAMLKDANSEDFVEHVSKTACIIANSMNIPAFVVDPVSTDEYEDISRICGLPELSRKSLTHALNMKAAARSFAGEEYENMNLITAHLGGGCSLAVHKKGRMVDSVDANGEGPFSSERSGTLRVDDLARWVLESGKDFREIRKILTRQSGLMGHLGTTDAREVVRRIEAGDEKAKMIFEAMAYNVSKHICALSAAVSGKVDGVILTGGLAHSKVFTDMVTERVSFLADVKVFGGEMEMEALRDGVLRVLNGTEKVKIYPHGEYEA